jgi:hypothetical protein
LNVSFALQEIAELRKKLEKLEHQAADPAHAASGGGGGGGGDWGGSGRPPASRPTTGDAVIANEAAKRALPTHNFWRKFGWGARVDARCGDGWRASAQVGAATIEELFYKLHLMQSKIDRHEMETAAHSQLATEQQEQALFLLNAKMQEISLQQQQVGALCRVPLIACLPSPASSAVPDRPHPLRRPRRPRRSLPRPPSRSAPTSASTRPAAPPPPLY